MTLRRLVRVIAEEMTRQTKNDLSGKLVKAQEQLHAAAKTAKNWGEWDLYKELDAFSERCAEINLALRGVKF